MADLKVFRLFETHPLIDLAQKIAQVDIADIIGDLKFRVETGSRFVFTLYVAEIDAGTSVRVQIRNTFSRQVPYQPIDQLIADGVGYKKTILVDMHNMFEIVPIIEGGGEARFYLGVTVNDNADKSGGGGTDPGGGDPGGGTDTPGVAKFFDSEEETLDAGVPQTLIEEIVPANMLRVLTRAKVTCRFEGSYDILSDDERIGFGKTGPGNPDSVIVWSPSRPVAAGKVIKLVFTSRTGAAATATVKALMQAVDSIIP